VTAAGSSSRERFCEFWWGVTCKKTVRNTVPLWQKRQALLGRQEKVRLRFNLSHSDGMAVFAVSSGRQIGVDLKYNSENVSIEGIAQRVFSALEIAALES